MTRCLRPKANDFKFEFDEMIPRNVRIQKPKKNEKSREKNKNGRTQKEKKVLL